MPSDRLQQLAVSKEGFVFDPATGESYSVNATGRFILERLVGGTDPETIAGELADRYEMDREEIYRDVLDFVDHLRAYRLQ